MIANFQGFPKDRFPELTGDSFDCGICYLVAKDPKECLKCGTMYCGPCIDDWVSKKNECPLGCIDARGNVKPISGALSKIYRNLNVKCKYPKCNKVLPMSELEQHEAVCQLPQCEFFGFCGSYVKPEFKQEGVCSLVCQFMKKIKQSNGNWKPLYEDLKNLANVPKRLAISQNPSNNALTSFRWDQAKLGQGIELSNDKKTVFLKESGYLFKSAVSDTPMTNGIYYWEIHADTRTENELKIGITTKGDFKYDTAFCDFEYGFAYYGLGQLRHNSNSVGTAYGKKFKKEGVLGVCLDMTKGTLSFALNGEYWGEAYRSDALKKGPIFVAVALLHCAGCTLETEKPVPQYFLKK
jgi:E3 ubiquitin-protein ligase NRDP1